MQFDTKIALVIRSDLETWQKMNVAAFLASGIAAAFPACIGAPYEDGSGTPYHPLIGQPVLIYGADRSALVRALDRACSRNVKAAVYTQKSAIGGTRSRDEGLKALGCRALPRERRFDALLPTLTQRTR